VHITDEREPQTKSGTLRLLASVSGDLLLCSLIALSRAKPDLPDLPLFVPRPIARKGRQAKADAALTRQESKLKFHWHSKRNKTEHDNNARHVELEMDASVT
jgi:hypothetical protein